MSSQIPGYQIIKKVGEGGMSTVYLAIQFSVGREVALKVLSPELRSEKGFAERFYREANIVGALSHPNVISIFDAGKQDSHYYMSMDYLPGSSCKQKIKSREIPPRHTLRILNDVTKAVSYVHQQGYLHCDIKPDNVLFRSDGSAVLTDFGITRELHAHNSTTVSGTPHYMSPEQAQGKKLDATSDIYSLGVFLFEMLTGSPPYVAKDPVALAIKHISAPIPTLPPELSEYQTLINRAMAKRPGSRYRTASELLQAISDMQELHSDNSVRSANLKVSLKQAISSLSHRLKNWLYLGKQVQFSRKHGVILRNHTKGYELPDVDELLHTLQSLQTFKESTLDTTVLRDDSIALAIEAEHAKILINNRSLLIGGGLIVALGLATAAILNPSLIGLAGMEVQYVD